MPDSLATQLGIQSGDTILSINELPITSINLSDILRSLHGQDLTLVIQRNEQIQTMSGVCPPDTCVLGVIIDGIDMRGVVYEFSLAKSAWVALRELYAQAVLTLDRLGSLGASFFSGSLTQVQQEVSSLSGPVAAVKLGDMLIDNGLWKHFLTFAAMISFALAIFNILPIPALDGGRLVGVIIQRIFFTRHPDKYFQIEGYINFFFFVALMALGLYILCKDLVVAWGISIPFIS